MVRSMDASCPLLFLLVNSARLFDSQLRATSSSSRCMVWSRGVGLTSALPRYANRPSPPLGRGIAISNRVTQLLLHVVLADLGRLLRRAGRIGGPVKLDHGPAAEFNFLQRGEHRWQVDLSLAQLDE